ncbi:MAG TPA: hypothetical protein VF499_13385, partial [Afipia sp.]
MMRLSFARASQGNSMIVARTVWGRFTVLTPFARRSNRSPVLGSIARVVRIAEVHGLAVRSHGSQAGMRRRR